MSGDDLRVKALVATCENILAAASADPVLAERALRRLNADTKLAPFVQMPPGMKRTGRRRNSIRSRSSPRVANSL